MVLGYAEENIFSDISFDMTGQNYGIDFQYSNYNQFSGIVCRNIPSNKYALTFRQLSKYNTVEIAYLDNQTNARAVYYASDVVGNVVNVLQTSNPTLAANGVKNLYTMASVGMNYFSCSGFPTIEEVSILNNVLSVNNRSTTLVKVFTPNSPNVDTINTITDGFQQEGRVLTLYPASDAYTLTVNHKVGNIRLTGGTSYTLSSASATLTLMYVKSVLGWVEISRGGA